MEQLTLKECQTEALKVLLKFDKICKENHFKYFIMWGTLIGAIRHNGFIPWDDDLDVMMPREDFDKLVQYMQENVKELLPYKLCMRSNTENYWYGIPRFANTEFEYVTENKHEKPFEIGTFIDVYPLDNCGNTLEEAKVLNKTCLEKNIQFARYINAVSPGSFVRNIAKHIAHYYLRCVKPNNYKKKVDEEIRNYVLSHTSVNDKYCGLVVWDSPCIPFEKEKLGNLKLVDHVFEGHMFPIPVCYDYILKAYYGDYMKLPPENERNPHHAYKIFKK